ncbi:hypothetical protein, partial [Shewanella xiamenensis]
MTEAILTHLVTEESEVQTSKNTVSLTDFIHDFGSGLLANVENAYPARYQHACIDRDMVMHSLKR